MKRKRNGVQGAGSKGSDYYLARFYPTWLLHVPSKKERWVYWTGALYAFLGLVDGAIPEFQMPKTKAWR